MWSPSGQPDFIDAGIVRKKGSGGGLSPWQQYMTTQQTATDPVTGRQFTSSPMGGGPTASDQLNTFIAQREAQAKSDSDAAAAKAAADAATAETTFQGKKSDAYNTAMADAIRAFQGAGVDVGKADDPNSYLSKYITPSLQRQLAQIQDLDPNPLASFPTSLGSTILNTAVGDKRTAATNALSKVFTPGYSTTALPDTADTGAIDTIINEQFDPLKAQLVNAQKRGRLTDVGYQGATDELNKKLSAARDTVTNLGKNIIATDRSAIDDIISGAKTDASGLSLADTFDPTVYTTRASNLATSDIAGLPGALRNAVGNTTFADITDLLNAGGAVQGTTNQPTPTGTTGSGGSSLTPDQQAALQQQKRGLGSTGAF